MSNNHTSENMWFQRFQWDSIFLANFLHYTNLLFLTNGAIAISNSVGFAKMAVVVTNNNQCFLNNNDCNGSQHKAQLEWPQ